MTIIIGNNTEIEWETQEDAPYRYMATLHHKPTGMEILQASDKSFSEAKSACIKELTWRLAHWAEYKKSSIKEIGV